MLIAIRTSEEDIPLLWSGHILLESVSMNIKSLRDWASLHPTFLGRTSSNDR